MQPKNSPPRKLMEAAGEAESEVEMDLTEKLGPLMEALKPAERKALESAAVALASKIVGEALSRDQGLQAFAVALTALNAYRQSLGESQIDPEAVNPMMLSSMIEELIRDEDFLAFIAGEAEVEVEGPETEDEGEEEDSMVESPKSLMNRRSTLMGAM